MLDKIMNNGAPFQGKYCDEFSALLLSLKPERKAIAADLGIPYSTLDNFVRGLAAFPPDLIPRLFAVTGDWRIWEFLLRPCGLKAVHEIGGGASPAPDIFQTFLFIAQRLGEAISEYKRSIEDKKISPVEYARVSYYITEMERLTTEAREILREAVK
jgi:hypothetical protein